MLEAKFYENEIKPDEGLTFEQKRELQDATRDVINNVSNLTTITNLVTSSDRALQAIVVDFGTSVATGDGKFYFHIDARLDGKRIKDIHAEVITAGTTGTTDIQIANVDAGVDILTTKLTIDSGETGSDTAATPAIITVANAGVTLNQVLRIDVDAVSTTAPKGLIITLGFGT